MLPLKEYSIFYYCHNNPTFCDSSKKYHKSQLGIYVTHILIVKIPYGCFCINRFRTPGSPLNNQN